jgi:8-oxo-dGTP pyrophosphatase MutT (NUDIX family)
MQTTWDGKEIHPEPPYGSTIVVYRNVEGELQVLLLHRSHEGPDFAGDWAWTPPAGSRQPGETIEQSTKRELAEETGLNLPVRITDFGSESWFVYTAEATEKAEVDISREPEHDRYEWVSPEEAIKRCAPDLVKLPLAQAIDLIMNRGL